MMMKLDTVICGDCLDVMRDMPDGCIDLIVTDPPYNLGKDYGDFSDDSLTDSEYWAWIGSVFDAIYRVLRDGSYLYTSHSDKGMFDLYYLLKMIGFSFLQMIVWHGPNGYSMQRARKTWSYRHEPILIFEKGDALPLLEHEGVWYTSVIKAARPQTNFKDKRIHPTQKPLDLYYKIIDRTPGDIVFDPFVGSGTSAIAALRADRHFYGCDINPEYVKLANERIEKTRLELSQLELAL